MPIERSKNKYFGSDNEEKWYWFVINEAKTGRIGEDSGIEIG